MSKREQSRLEKIYKQSRLKPPYDKWPLLKRLWVFQNERVPIAALFIVGLLLNIAVAKLANHHIDWLPVIIATTLSTLYFIQVRLADEPKDFEHDNKYHPKRPVQRGLVSLGELSTTKRLVIGIFMIIACLTGSLTVVVFAVLQQAYSYLTHKEFFVRDWLREHFFIYQFSHYIQLPILAWLSVMVFGIEGFNEQLLYFGYILAMSGPIELSRTIGGIDEKQAGDRYSYKLGTRTAIALFLALTGIVIGYTVILLQYSGNALSPILLVIGLLAVAWATLRYEHHPVVKNADILNGSSLIMYICAAGTLLIS